MKYSSELRKIVDDILLGLINDERALEARKKKVSSSLRLIFSAQQCGHLGHGYSRGTRTSQDAGS